MGSSMRSRLCMKKALSRKYDTSVTKKVWWDFDWDMRDIPMFVLLVLTKNGSVVVKYIPFLVVAIPLSLAQSARPMRVD